MGWELLEDVAAFENVAGAYLRTDPVAHTVVLGALRQPGPGIAGERGIYAVLRAGGTDGTDGTVIGAAWRMPPYPIGVTEVDGAAIGELATLLLATRPDLARATSVVGPAASCAPLADLLGAGLGLTVKPMLTETLYRLDGPHLLVPDARPVSGRARPVASDDVPLLAEWLVAFTEEAGTTRADDPEERIRRAIPDAEILVWEDGGPVCMVGARPTGDGVARIGPVYTPPTARGRGYATAATVAATRVMFTRGVRIVTLYADDANAVSTGIYRRLGFRAFAAWIEVSLHP